MTTSLDLYAAASSNTITVTDVALDGTARADATVATTIVDEATSQPVSGTTWPVTLAPVANQDGTYRVTLDKTVAFAAGRRYRRTTTIAVGGVSLTLVDRGIGVEVDG